MSEYTAEQALTHHVALVLDNDEALYNERREIVAQSVEQVRTWEAETGLSDDEGTVRVSFVADALKDLAESAAVPDPDGDGFTTMGLEIISTALAFVAWRGLARGYIAEESE